MKRMLLFVAVLFVVTIAASSFKSQTTSHKPSTVYTDTIRYSGEKHFANVQQLTFGGDNAEAYFSFDGKWIIFQKTYLKEGIPCDQMYIGKVPAPGEKFEPKLISTGKGRTTCGAFLKDGKHVVYASTHLGADT